MMEILTYLKFHPAFVDACDQTALTIIKMLIQLRSQPGPSAALFEVATFHAQVVQFTLLLFVYSHLTALQRLFVDRAFACRPSKTETDVTFAIYLWIMNKMCVDNKRVKIVTSVVEIVNRNKDEIKILDLLRFGFPEFKLPQKCSQSSIRY